MLQGLGIGRLPTFVAGPDIKSGKLVPLFENYEMLQQSIYAVFLERQYMPAKVRAFLDFSIDYFGGDQPYWDA
jgi:DNA-binding transcriptional LysR family regulator